MTKSKQPATKSTRRPTKVTAAAEKKQGITSQMSKKQKKDVVSKIANGAKLTVKPGRTKKRRRKTKPKKITKSDRNMAREIKKEQNRSHDRVLPLEPLRRFAKEVAQKRYEELVSDPNDPERKIDTLCIGNTAVKQLRVAAEEFILRQFQEAEVVRRRVGVKTLGVDDMRAVQQIHSFHNFGTPHTFNEREEEIDSGYVWQPATNSRQRAAKYNHTKGKRGVEWSAKFKAEYNGLGYHPKGSNPNMDVEADEHDDDDDQDYDELQAQEDEEHQAHEDLELDEGDAVPEEEEEEVVVKTKTTPKKKGRSKKKAAVPVDSDFGIEF